MNNSALIALATLILVALLVLLTVLVYRRLHRRLEDLSRQTTREHGQMMEAEFQRHDSTWAKVDLVRGHVLKLIAGVVAPWKKDPPIPPPPEGDNR